MTQTKISTNFDTYKIAKAFIVLSFLWFAASYGDVYLNTKEIKTQVKIALRTAVLDTDEEVINKLLSHFNKKNIPVEEEDILIKRTENGDRARIIVKYSDTVTYFGVGFYNYYSTIDLKSQG